MSKKTQNKNSKVVYNDKNKWYAVIGGYVILFIAVAYFACVSFLGNFNPLAWGKGKAADVPPASTATVLAITEDGRALHAGETYALPSRMTFLRSQTDDNFVSDKLQLTPSLSNKYVVGEFLWAAKWLEDCSDWATDKNVYDYVELALPEGAEESAESVEVSVKQAFCEPIILTSRLVGTESVATCQLDYLQRINLSGYDFYGGYSDTCSIEAEVSYGLGTVQGGSMTLKRASLALRDVFLDYLKESLTFEIETKSYSFEGSPCIFSNGYCYSDFADCLDFPMFICDYDNLTDEQKYAICYAWDKANGKMGSNFSNALIDFEFEFYYCGELITSYSDSDLFCYIDAGYDGYWEYSFNVLLNGGYVF